MATVEDLLDKQAIHEALMRYCRGVDRGDAELINSAYHPHAADDHGRSQHTGESVGPALVELLRTATLCMHHVTNELIVLHGDGTAGCESYFACWQSVEIEGRPRVLQALGRYVDGFERRDGDWRIAHRLVIVEHTHLLPEGEAIAPSRPDVGSRDRHDPSYAVLGFTNSAARSRRTRTTSRGR